MANLDDSAEWIDALPALARTDRADADGATPGDQQGPLNRAPRVLGKRTRYLKALLDRLGLSVSVETPSLGARTRVYNYGVRVLGSLFEVFDSSDTEQRLLIDNVAMQGSLPYLGYGGPFGVHGSHVIQDAGASHTMSSWSFVCGAIEFVGTSPALVQASVPGGVMSATTPTNRAFTKLVINRSSGRVRFVSDTLAASAEIPRGTMQWVLFSPSGILVLGRPERLDVPEVGRQLVLSEAQPWNVSTWFTVSGANVVVNDLRFVQVSVRAGDELRGWVTARRDANGPASSYLGARLTGPGGEVLRNETTMTPRQGLTVPMAYTVPPGGDGFYNLYLYARKIATADADHAYSATAVHLDVHR